MANRPKKKEEHPVREWISDNLRYMELGVLIILIIVVAILLIRTISNRNNSADTNIQSASAESSVSAESSAASETESVNTESVVSASSEEAVASSSEETEEEEAVLTEDSGNVAEAVQNYFDALILNGENGDVTVYDNFQTYVYPAENSDSNTQIVFVRYTYEIWGIDGVEVPALTELMIQDNGDGTASVLTEVSEEQSAQMAEAVQSSAVQEMISEVQAAHDQVVSANQALADYEAIKNGQAG